ASLADGRHIRQERQGVGACLWWWGRCVGGCLYGAALSSPSTPHDAVFRRILGTPSNAASKLRAVLPPGLVARLDLDRLVLVPGEPGRAKAGPSSARRRTRRPGE